MQQRSPSRAFTLIELLIVITIIAILMGLLFPAFRSVQDQAKRAQAKNDETQIATAVTAYFTEYGKYPLIDVKQGFDTLYGDPGGSYGNEDVFNVLRALPIGVNAGDVLNSRKIVFFNGASAKDAVHPRSGFATQDTTGENGSSIKTGAFVDPWGNTYMVAIDGDYDGSTIDYLPYSDLNYTQLNTSGGVKPGVGAACFGVSFGKDGKQGTKGDGKYKGSDDVVSWQ
jgi:prepilin-type N-terminal cleavage/methylation domain-containing protein